MIQKDSLILWQSAAASFAKTRRTVLRHALMRRLFVGALIFGSVLVPGLRAAEVSSVVKSPLSPQESLKAFRVAADLQVEIVASEPEVVAPVCIAFDEDGRLWVVEMSDYPNGPTPGEPPKSRIKLLEDRDADGRFETAHIFADNLLFATGVQPWRGGVIVTLGGEIAYLKDTDGDYRADVRETWFRGFAQENPQLRANHPRFAYDNYIYVANGLRGGTIIGEKQKWGGVISPVSINGKDFRFDPLTGACDAVSGNGQFGLTFDDFGNRFVCSNRNPCRHVVLEDRYLKRNPFLAVRDVCHDVSPAAEKSQIFPITRAWTTSNLHAGQFTAACGVFIHRGDKLPVRFQGNSFVCDPTGNLVHRDILEQDGSTFKSLYAKEKVEFLASSDEWFRPVDLADGPDGALYIVDMYRAVIEHPEWVPTELKNRADLYDGSDRGRIYRVVSKDKRIEPERRGKMRLSDLPAHGLASLIAHPNAWQRAMAARLLFERQDKSAVAMLERLAGDPAGTLPSRVLALHVLHGLKCLSDELLAGVLSEPASTGDSRRRAEARPVQQHAIALSESKLRDSKRLRKAILNVSSPAGIELQLALSLGEAESVEQIYEALARIAIAGANDEWMRQAAYSSVSQAPQLLLHEILNDIKRTAHNAPPEAPDYRPLLRELFEIVGARREAKEMAPELATLLAIHTRGGEEAESIARNFAAINGWGRGLTRRGGSVPQAIDQMDELETGLRADLAHIFDQAGRTAHDFEVPIDLRLEAIGVLQFAPFAIAGPALFNLVKSDPFQELRGAAIEVLSTFDDSTVGLSLMADFRSQTPGTRRRVLQAMLRTTPHTKVLLYEIEAQRVALAELDPATIQALTNHRDESIRDVARGLLALVIPADRKQVLETYQRALTLSADAKRGQVIFEKHCTTCHKIGALGVDVAPDISDSRTKTPAQLLNDILNPNQAIDSNFVSYTIVTNDGKAETGIISTETSTSITVRQPEGKTVLILRQEIKEILSNGVSLMPEGLEKNITVEQMADLVSFVKNWRYLYGAVPLAK